MKCMAVLFDHACNGEDNDDTKLEKRAHAEDRAALFFKVAVLILSLMKK